MNVELVEQLDLSRLNMLRLPAVARYVANITCYRDLDEALIFGADRGLRPIPLGSGSNVVLNDLPDALVLLMDTRGMDVLDSTSDFVRVRVAAGQNWHEFVIYAHQRGWYGLENLALIPGTVGAAPIQNIGAYGVEISQFIDSIEVLDSATGATRVMSADECEFAYRDSLFKHPSGQGLIILSVTFRFSQHSTPVCDYPALKAELESMGRRGTAFDILEAVICIREAKLPDPSRIPNVGSFFKNPVITEAQWVALHERSPGAVHWAVTGGVKLAAAWLVEHAGWRGHAEERVGIHSKQSLVLVNRGGATAADVLDLAARIQDSVEQQFGVRLELEPVVY